MLSTETQIRINKLNYYRLEKLADWCWKRYAKTNGFVKMPPVPSYIVRRHYHWEEAKAGLL